MPIQAPQWTEFLSCPICYYMFDETNHRPISLACGHTVCKICLSQLPQKICPFDQNAITRSVEELPVNFALLQLVGVAVPEEQIDTSLDLSENLHHYNGAKKCIEELAIFLKPLPQVSGNVPNQPPVSTSQSPLTNPFLSRPMQRKLVALVNCQLIEEEGRARAIKAARSLGERTVTEMILLHQNPQQLSANLWAAVRARGCQFLGPAMQEEVLKLILLALEDGSALSRKVLVLFVVQRLETQYPQASKTAIGHVVQLLYRASCFKVTKREEESSLMQLKEEFRTYEALRREHDSQIVQIATEAGLRISPEQWSSLLYGDMAHKSHMQSIIDKLQTPQSFYQSINELTLALQRTGDPGNLNSLRDHLELLASVDPNAENGCFESWEKTSSIMVAVLEVVRGLLNFTALRAKKGIPPEMITPTPGVMPHNAKYKTSMCRDLTLRGQCPRGSSCTFAHSSDEMERFRARSKKLQHPVSTESSGSNSRLAVGSIGKKVPTSSALSPKERQELAHVTQVAEAKLAARQSMTTQAHIKNDTITSSGSDSAVMSVKQSKDFHSISNVQPSVHVPVAKPSALPGSSKQILGKKDGIYSSRTSLTSMERKQVLTPTIMPTAKKLPTMMVSPHANKPQKTMLAPPHVQPVSVAPVVSSRQNTRQTTVLNPDVLPSRSVSTSQNSTPKTSLESFVRSAVSMPPNPYTAYATNITNKTPTEQLGDLQKRRNELLSRLNYSQSVGGELPLTLSVSDSGRALSLSPSLSPSNVSPKDSFNGSLPSSIASSLASIISAASSGSFMTSAASTANSSWMSIANPSSASLTTTTSTTKSNEEKKNEQHMTSINSSLSMSVADSVAMSHLVMSLDGCHKSEDVHHTDSQQYKDSVYNSFLEMNDVEEDNQYGNPVMSSCGWLHPSDDEYGDCQTLQCHMDDQDEFVPFEHTRVSKYGPISRKDTRDKLKYFSPPAPVNVTAGQNREMIPVMAVTPNQHRPYPITCPVASRFGCSYASTGQSQSDHHANPYGKCVASSLPTALLQPNVIAAAADCHNNQHLSEQQPHTLWALREKMLSLSSGALLEPTQIQDELCDVSRRIQNLQLSEEERLSRELQAIELNIQETKKKKVPTATLR